MNRPYAYQTAEGQQAIALRNETAEYFATVHGWGVTIDPNPLQPIAVTFRRRDGVEVLAIIRNRSERSDGFSYPTILITSDKLDLLANMAQARNCLGLVIVRMADDVLFCWTAFDTRLGRIRFPEKSTVTKGDCMGSHHAERRNCFLPLSTALTIRPNALI